MLDEDKHVYYWGWAEYDNPNAFRNPQGYRVFRLTPKINAKDEPVTEPMSRDEAIAYCKRIVKLTGGRIL